MSTFTKLEALPKFKEDVDAKVIGQFRKKLIPTEVVFLRARNKEAQFVAHKSRYVPVNAKTEFPSSHATAESSRVEELATEESLLMMQWKKVFGASRGISNYGNTCFMNSALQCIVNTAPLTQYLIEKDVECPWSSQKRFCTFCELRRLVKDSFDHSRANRSIKPHNIVSNLKQIGPTFRPGRQEDSHELLREILAKSDEAAAKHFSTFLEYYPRPIAPLLPGEEPPPKPKPTSLFFAIFGSYLRSRVTCQKCNYNSDTFDPYMDLSIELQGHSLERSLKHFTSPEELDVDNMYKCGKCKKRTQPIKTLSLWQPPNILTIHLKRFNIFGRKINKQISYPEILDLSPYFAKDSPFASHKTHTYNLYAVLLHHGSTSRSGHYTAMVKASNGVWMDANDEMMSKVSKATALNHHDAYILFYARHDPIPSPSSRNVLDKVLQRKKLEKMQADMIASTTSSSSHTAPSTSKSTPTKTFNAPNRNSMDVDDDSSSQSEDSSSSAESEENSSQSDDISVSSSESDSEDEVPVKQVPIKRIKAMSQQERQKYQRDAIRSLFGVDAMAALEPVAKKAAYDPQVFKSRELYGGHMVDSWSFGNGETVQPASSSSMTTEVAEAGITIGDQTAESIIEANLKAKKMANRAMSDLQLLAKSRKKQARSAYDIDYDRGKLKKVKRKEMDTPGGAGSYAFNRGDERRGGSGHANSHANGNSKHGGGFGRDDKSNAFQRRTDEIHKGQKFGESPKSHANFKGGADKVKRLQKQRREEMRKKGNQADQGGQKKQYYKKPFWKSKK